MVDEKVVNDTVKRMLDSGIDQPTIVDTLKDIGLSEEDAKNIIQKISSEKEESQKLGQDQEEGSEDAQKATQEVRHMKEEMAAQGERQDSHETNTNAKLEEHEGKINEMGQKVDEVHKKVGGQKNRQEEAFPPKAMADLNAKLDEVSASTKATRSLMQKVLEVNQKILSELESKR